MRIRDQKKKVCNAPHRNSCHCSVCFINSSFFEYEIFEATPLIFNVAVMLYATSTPVSNAVPEMDHSDTFVASAYQNLSPRRLRATTLPQSVPRSQDQNRLPGPFLFVIRGIASSLVLRVTT